MITPRRLAGSLLLLLLAGGVAFAAAQHQADDADPLGSGRDHVPPRVTSDWEKLESAARRARLPRSPLAAVRAAYAVMRTPPEPVPHLMALRTVETLGAPLPALRFADAQYVDTRRGPLWIVSGRDLMCIVEAGRGSTTCDTTRNFLRRGLIVSIALGEPGQERPQRFKLMGVAPDEVKSVEVEVGAKKTLAIPVRSNGFAFQAGQILIAKRFRY